MTILAVLCDFGGVLYKPPNIRWLMRVQRLLGKDLDHLLFGLYLSPTQSPYVKDVMSGKIDEAEVWDALSTRFHIHPKWLDHMRNNTYHFKRLNRPMIDFLQSLRPEYKTAVLTNAASNFRATFVQAFHIESWADQVIISAEEGVAKPDPEIFKAAVNRIGVHPHEAVLIDDLHENVTGARSAGLHAVQFRNNRQALTEIKRYIYL